MVKAVDSAFRPPAQAQRRAPEIPGKNESVEGDESMAPLAVRRVGFALGTGDVRRLADFYAGVLGFEPEVFFDDPPYAILTGNGMRLSLAEEGHPAPDLPGRVLTAGRDARKPHSMIILEVEDCDAAYAGLRAAGVEPATPIFRPPWGGARFFLTDPDDNLIEVEQPA